MNNDDFYIGWSAKAAPVPGAFVKRITIGVLIIAAAIAAVVAVSQKMIGDGTWDWTNKQTFEGRFVVAPAPHLIVPGDGTYYLVAEWKFGIPDKTLAEFSNQTVTLEGTLIRNGDRKMIEVVADSIDYLKKPSPELAVLVASDPQPGGIHSFVGEIVDSKCHLGVMNPGNLKTHRACAIRCISGGIPPVLLVRRNEGPPAFFHLTGSNGEAINDQILDKVAEPVRVRGQIETRGEVITLKTDPATIERVTN